MAEPRVKWVQSDEPREIIEFDNIEKRTVEGIDFWYADTHRGPVMTWTLKDAEPREVLDALLIVYKEAGRCK